MLLFPQGKANTTFRTKFVEPDTDVTLSVSNQITENDIFITIIDKVTRKSMVVKLDRESANLLSKRLKG